MLVVAAAESNDCPEHLKIDFKNHGKRLHQISLQGTNVSHLGKKKVIFKSGWGGIYVSSQKGSFMITTLPTFFVERSTTRSSIHDVLDSFLGC